jgi:hypothetical protein
MDYSIDKSSTHDDKNDKKITFEDIAPRWSKRLAMLMVVKGSFYKKESSIPAVNTSLIVLAGALREITVSIVGNSKDFAVEVASGSWFESLLIPGVTGYVVGGPLGGVGGTTVGLIMAYQFERKIWKRIREAINKESKKKPMEDQIEHYGK